MKIQPGNKFGRLSVISFDEGKKCKCKCDCGNELIVLKTSLISGNTKSCGCLARDLTIARNFKHGQSRREHRTRINRIWQRMRQRCNDPNSSDKNKYYHRGITVCDEWDNSFSSFYDWAKTNGYRDDLTIERKNNNLGYCPSNCEWIPPALQARNKRNNHLIRYNGEVKTLAEWSEISGLESSLIRYRLKHWPIDKILIQPTK